MMFWAASCTGFFGFLRCGEFTTNSPNFDQKFHLSLEDVQVDRSINPTVLFLRLKTSKTDPFRKGRTLRIGATGTPICAVRALMAFLHRRGSKPGPLFMLQSGIPLTRQTFIHWLKCALNRLGIDGNYSGHSFRIGAATTAAATGVPDHLIKTLGRWLSNAYQVYLRTLPALLEQVASRLVSDS